MSQSINLWHSDLWSVSMSNIPTCSPDDMYLFENFIKSAIIPEHSGENENNDAFIGMRAEHPIGHDLNRTLGIVQLEFKLDEHFRNYTILFNWMFNIRYGKNINTERLRDYVCNELNITIYDNKKRSQGRFCFTKATCIGISAIPLTYGTGEEVTYQANFDYEEVLWIADANVSNCEQ